VKRLDGVQPNFFSYFCLKSQVFIPIPVHTVRCEHW